MKKAGERGQALVEFALVLPVLVLLLLVSIESSRLLLAKMAADRIARESAEMAASVGAPTSEVWAYVDAQVADLGSTLGDVQRLRLVIRNRSQAERCQIVYPATASCRAAYGDWVQVTVEVRVSTWFGNVDLRASHLASAWRAFTP